MAKIAIGLNIAVKNIGEGGVSIQEYFWKPTWIDPREFDHAIVRAVKFRYCRQIEHRAIGRYVRMSSMMYNTRETGYIYLITR